jgi:hypothetical protein
MSNSCAAAAQVENNIPISCARSCQSGGKHFKEATIMLKAPAAFVICKVAVVHQDYIALMGAIHFDNITIVQILARVKKIHLRSSFLGLIFVFYLTQNASVTDECHCMINKCLKPIWMPHRNTSSSSVLWHSFMCNVLLYILYLSNSL